MKRFFKKTIVAVTLFEVILLTASLLWCGDADCWSGSSDDQCSSLICSLFANHSGSNEGGDASTECSCVCHVPTMLVHSDAAKYHPPVLNTYTEITISAPAAPSRQIYHPPLAS